MKKFMKVVLPILLVLLILGSIYWYGFVYDRDFTRDMLLKQARRFSTTNNPKLASWFYDLAYNHSGQDDGVAIELANQFKAAGNYTKAEVTLSNAIADGGSTELYIALCKTYVEQDKLLDAVEMLNNIKDPVIKAELDAMRPAAPTSAPAPGFYSEYISVSLTGEDGTLYCTTGMEYPSTDDVPYAEPFTLAAGETIVYALSVADNGLVSPLSILNYTVGGVIEEVYFEDPAIETAIRSMLGIENGRVLFSNELWNIKAFTVPADAASFTDLAKLSYLENLTLEGHTVDSLAFLNSLTNLKELKLIGCSLSPEELNIIASVPMLQRLTLSDCGLSTIAGLEKAQNLIELDLSDNTIRNLEPLSAIMGLRTLNLNHNALTGLTALSNLGSLERLDVSYNSLTSIAPIATCTNLAWLDVSNNNLPDLGAIDNLPELSHFSADQNELTDVAILGNCVNLTELSIANNTITDISALATLVNLEIFDFSHNQVENLPQWPDGCKLRTINGSNNALTSLSALKNMHELSHVYMDYNKIKSVADLAGCYKLVMVNVYGNDVTGVDKLTEHDIIVNYDPT